MYPKWIVEYVSQILQLKSSSYSYKHLHHSVFTKRYVLNTRNANPITRQVGVVLIVAHLPGVYGIHGWNNALCSNDRRNFHFFLRWPRNVLRRVCGRRDYSDNSSRKDNEDYAVVITHGCSFPDRNQHRPVLTRGESSCGRLSSGLGLAWNVRDYLLIDLGQRLPRCLITRIFST